MPDNPPLPSCKKIPCKSVQTAKAKAIKATEMAKGAKDQAKRAQKDADVAQEIAQKASITAQLNKAKLAGYPFIGAVGGATLVELLKAYSPKVAAIACNVWDLFSGFF